jgi:hypothetical protein
LSYLLRQFAELRGNTAQAMTLLKAKMQIRPGARRFHTSALPFEMSVRLQNVSALRWHRSG